jgi:hypothetical protein
MVTFFLFWARTVTDETQMSAPAIISFNVLIIFIVLLVFSLIILCLSVSKTYGKGIAPAKLVLCQRLSCLDSNKWS